jgi:hypothetical protein
VHLAIAGQLGGKSAIGEGCRGVSGRRIPHMSTKKDTNVCIKRGEFVEFVGPVEIHNP